MSLKPVGGLQHGVGGRCSRSGSGSRCDTGFMILDRGLFKLYLGKGTGKSGGLMFLLLQFFAEVLKATTNLQKSTVRALSPGASVAGLAPAALAIWRCSSTEPRVWPPAVPHPPGLTHALSRGAQQWRWQGRGVFRVRFHWVCRSL